VNVVHTASGMLLADAYVPDSDVTGALDQVLGYMAWFVTVAAVAGLLIIGSRMAIALRSGEGAEHLTQFAVVMGACVIGAMAGPRHQAHRPGGPQGTGRPPPQGRRPASPPTPPVTGQVEQDQPGRHREPPRQPGAGRPRTPLQLRGRGAGPDGPPGRQVHGHRGTARPAGLRACGSVLLTSNKADVYSVTRAERERVGQVWTFDPQGIAHTPRTLWWDMLADASTRDADIVVSVTGNPGILRPDHLRPHHRLVVDSGSYRSRTAAYGETSSARRTTSRSTSPLCAAASARWRWRPSWNEWSAGRSTRTPRPGRSNRALI